MYWVIKNNQINLYIEYQTLWVETKETEYGHTPYKKYAKVYKADRKELLLRPIKQYCERTGTDRSFIKVEEVPKEQYDFYKGACIWKEQQKETQE